MNTPDIQVQLVHIDGPFKGNIDEFFSTTISFGRHPDCDVTFPEDQTVISRKHCEIRRDGNRFKLVDNSSNGTLVNGRKEKEVYLKTGDVLIIGPNGPKISFLSTIVEGKTRETKEQDSPLAEQPEAPVTPQPPSELKERNPIVFKPKAESVTPSSQLNPETVQKNLVIQYGPALNSFKNLPITIGKKQGSDFVINHPSVLEEHAQIFFQNGKFKIKDLTGRNLMSLNLLPVHEEAILEANATLSFSPQGPSFQFLGDGRLVEIVKDESIPPQKQQASPAQPQPRAKTVQTGRKSALPYVFVSVLIILFVLLGVGLLLFGEKVGIDIQSYIPESLKNSLQDLFNKT